MNSFAELNLPHSGQGDGVETDLRKRFREFAASVQGKNENDVLLTDVHVSTYVIKI